MNKFNPDKVGKTTLKLCKEIVENEQHITAPLRVYKNIREQFTITKTVTEIVEMGYPQELVELIYNETFK